MMRKYLIKLFIGICVSSFSVNSCTAQYETAIGLRGGKYLSALTYKHFFDTYGSSAIEAQVGYTLEAYGGLEGKVFFIKQMPIQKAWVPFPFRMIFRQSRLQVPLKMIFGVGSHVGYFQNRYFKRTSDGVYNYDDDTFCAGIDATVGLEYNTRRMPFTFGIDATPYYSFLNPGPGWIDFGVNIRYVMK